ncbi:MAG: PKD domain-containing protein, partial [Gammaproteobacteria bacterium]|nr:PKD domain-containing protein [Desulfobacterales bacterium]NIR92274.1 PKD domain-containing protein [Gammaproteobacteria bacterium]
STPIANRTVTFDASNSTPGWNGTHHPPIVNYTWDFGNGNTTKVTKPEIEHTYSQAGNYTVTLTVTDAANQTGTISYIIEVLDLNKYDTNGDGVIDLKDVFRVALAYGSYPGHEAWDPVCDFNNDDTVDLKDYFAVALHYGEEL